MNNDSNEATQMGQGVDPAALEADRIAGAFAAFAEAYGGSVLTMRRAAAVDGHVLSALQTIAIVAVTGPTSAGLRIAAHQLTSAAEHVARVEAAHEAARAARATQAGQDGPEAPPAPSGHAGPAEDTYHVLTAEEEDADATLGADEAMAPEEDLRRWILDPGSDPWGDLLELPGSRLITTGVNDDGTSVFRRLEVEEGKARLVPADGADRAMRAGVTQGMVQARFDRIHAFLDSSTPPDGTTAEEWAAAKKRVLPVLSAQDAASA